jgi:hypothetical protein
MHTSFFYAYGYNPRYYSSAHLLSGKLQYSYTLHHFV